MTRLRLTAFALLCAVATQTSAACLGGTPLAAAQTWFERHYTFWNDTPAVLRDSFAPPLLDLLQREQACSAQGVCALDADPWLQAQDGEALDPEYVLEQAGEGGPVVRLRYRYVLDERVPAQTRELRLRFSGAGRCWRAADLIGPDGRSLLQTLRTYHDE